MNGYFCVLKLFQGAQNFLGDRYQSLRFAEAELSVWGAAAPQTDSSALSAKGTVPNADKKKARISRAFF